MIDKIKTVAVTMTITAVAWTCLAIHFYRTGKKDEEII